MVHYKLSLVWGFPVFIVYVRVTYGPLQTLIIVWGFPFFTVFVRVAYGPLQALASVGLSVFYRFC